MSELREPTGDRPEDRPPPESRAPIDLSPTQSYDPRDLVQPRGSRDEQVEHQLVDRPQLLALKDKVRVESEARFEPSDAEKLADTVERPEPDSERHDPEQLHRFGNKDRPGPVRLGDLKVESWDQIVQPSVPTAPTDRVRGLSTFADPYHPQVRLHGHFHTLPPDYQPPEGSGLAIHADGKDVNRDAPNAWGHRTIYPTEPMTAAEFRDRAAALPWEYVGNKKKGT